MSVLSLHAFNADDKTPPEDRKFDLSNCAREPIHIPGAIQPHGALVAFDADTSNIRHASVNLHEWLPTGALPTQGRALSSLIDQASWERIERAVRAPGLAGVRHAIVTVQPAEITAPAAPLQALVHRHRGQCIMELEATQEQDFDWLQAHADIMAALRSAADLGDLLGRLTTQVKRLCGFDRVMVYRFHPDWHGEVVAEVREPGMESFLGLHYPASDIPAQARELYRINFVRYVPDAVYTPVPVVPWLDTLNNQPLDLSHSALRSVSPIHLRYLQNMGVRSTLTLSIMVEGELWGMVACHHRSASALTLRLRQVCAAIAIGASYLVGWHAQRNRLEASRQAAVIQSRVVDSFNQVEVPLAEVVEASAAALLQLTGSTAGALWHGGEAFTFGNWPMGACGDELLRFAEHQLKTRSEDVLAFEELKLGSKEGGLDDPRVRGCIVARLGDFANSGLVWLRPEHRREVRWGGDPDKPAQLELDAQGLPVLSPRTSFEIWSTEVRGRCRPWGEADVAAAHSILPLRQLLAVRDSLGEVRESDRRFRALLDLQSDAYWQLDAQGRVVTLTKALVIDVGPIDGRTLPQLFSAHCAPATVNAIQHALDSGKAFRDLRLCSNAGDPAQEFELLLSGDPLRDRNSKVVGFHGTLTDATTQLRAGRELRRREAAELANETKSRFLSHVSHELRTPLNAVLGFSEMLLADPAASTAQLKQAGSIQKAGQWLLTMISDLLDVARIENGMLDHHPQATALAPLVTRAIEMLEPEAESLDVSIRFDAPWPLDAWCVNADPQRVVQVVLNLISNAIKYNRRSGAVAVTLARTVGTDGSNFISVAVRDTGSGLSTEQLSHVFEPFNRLGREGQGIHGSGLGLVIVQEIVHAMGGRIRVESEAQRGSCFTVDLPAAKAALLLSDETRWQPPDPEALNRTAPPVAAPAVASLPAGVVMYVEDEPTNAELMKAVVEVRTSASIVLVTSAEAALEQLQNERPQVMLIDINLPGKDGLWLLEAVRSDAALRDICCIAVTADAMADTTARLRAAGFDQCWHKPINLAWVGRTLQALLGHVARHGRPARLLFTEPHPYRLLSNASAEWLDTLDFGVIRLDAQGLTTAYNLRESLLSGYEPSAVIGKDFFNEVGRCMNNHQIAGRFAGVDSLDAIVNTVFKLKAQTVQVRLRLLKDAQSPHRFLLIDRLDASTSI